MASRPPNPGSRDTTNIELQRRANTEAVIEKELKEILDLEIKDQQRNDPDGLRSRRDSKRGINTTDSSIDDELLPGMLKEIKHLLWVENSPVLKKGLEEWRRRATLSASRLEQMKLRETSMKNEIIQVVGFYLVFQGVMITVVAQSEMLHENNLWSPMLLLSMAAVGALAGILQKSKALVALKVTIEKENDWYKEAETVDKELQRLGKQFRFTKIQKKRDSKSSEERHKRAFVRHWIPYILVLLYVVICTGLILLSHWRILVDPGLDDAPAKPPTP